MRWKPILFQFSLYFFSPYPCRYVIISTNFDFQDGNGFISKKELRLAMGKQGRKLTKQQIDKLMKETDSDGDGQISYDEFFASMVKNT